MRRAALTFGAGALSGVMVPLSDLIRHGRSAQPGLGGWFSTSGVFYLMILVAGGLTMLGCLALWRRLRWRPSTWAGWLGAGVAVSLLGAGFAGLLAGTVIGVASGDIQAPWLGLVFGLAYGLIGGAAPLGGLLFVWLARREARPGLNTGAPL